jgi:integrase
VRPPAQPRRQHTEPDRTELDRLLEVTATDPQLNAWLIVSATTGARRGEVLALRWSHINLDRAQILITQALDPIDGHEKGTKTGSTRMIAVGPATIAALRTWRTALRQRALATVGHLIDDPFVFTDTLDGSHPWRPDVATKRFGRIRNTAGTPTVRLHDLRHYVATTLLAAGIEPKTVAARLGHTRVATTSDLYAHAIPARDRAAANILDTGTV